MKIGYATLIGVAVWLLASTATAQDKDEDAALRRAEERGRLLYAYDRAGWVSTDSLLKKIPDLKSVGLAGWIVEGGVDRQRALYYRMQPDGPRAVYSAEVRNGGVVGEHVFGKDEERPLTALEVRMIYARSVPIPAAFRNCSAEPFNTVILPPRDKSELMSVYLLTPQTKRNEYPFGGHFEIDLSSSGNVEASRAFTKSCLAEPSVTPTGTKVVAMVITHILDPIPTEIHVYLSLSAGLPVYVGTFNPDRLWIVDGDKIALAPIEKTKKLRDFMSTSTPTP